MASEMTNYACPACGGPLHFVGQSGKLECDYCGGSYEVAEVEAMVKELDERAAKAAAENANSKWEMGGTDEWGVADGMKAYECPACGAELVCDENTAATCCPYCGNQTVVPGQFSGGLKPEFVIPFKTDKKQAKEALMAHYKGKTLLPKSFVDGNHIDEIQGVYVPFWMFDCEASGDMDYAASTSSTTKNGDKEITTTKHYDVKRSGKLKFEKVPVDASTRMPDGHMDSIEPYNYKELKDFSMAYMPGFLADRYDVEAEECGKRMQERCTKTFRDEVDKTVTGYDRHSVKSEAIVVKKGAVHYAMLPVWLLATTWNDQKFLFAMNGQTGKLVGDLPCDKGKAWGFFGGIGAALVLVMQLLNNLVFKTPMTGPTMVIVCILLPILIALLVVLGMKNSLRSVTSKKAAEYMAGTGLQLTRKTDTYIRTSTEVKTVGSGSNTNAGPVNSANKPAGNINTRSANSANKPAGNANTRPVNSANKPVGNANTRPASSAKK